MCIKKSSLKEFDKFIFLVLLSRSPKESRHIGGAGALTRRGSGSDGSDSKLNVLHEVDY
jgi:hypothetical protein